MHLPTQYQKIIEGDPPARLLLIHNFKFNEQGEIRHVRIAYDEQCLLD
jgi:hypothetical protein